MARRLRYVRIFSSLRLSSLRLSSLRLLPPLMIRPPFFAFVLALLLTYLNLKDFLNCMPNSADLTMDSIVDVDLDLTDSSVQLAQVIARAADDRKAADMILLKVGAVSSIADYFLIVTGFSKTQVRAIAHSIADEVEETLQRLPLRPPAGVSEGGWVLLDYGDVVVHIQTPQERDYYNLEAFWGHAERLNLAPLIGNTPVPA